MFCHYSEAFTCLYIPESKHAILTSACNQLSVRAKGDRPDIFTLGWQLDLLVVLGHPILPKTNRLIFTPAGNHFAKRAKINGPDPISMPRECLEQTTCFHIPQANSTIFAATCNDCITGIERNGADSAFMSFQSLVELERSIVRSPQAHPPILASYSKHRSLVIKSYRMHPAAIALKFFYALTRIKIPEPDGMIFTPTHCYFSSACKGNRPHSITVSLKSLKAASCSNFPEAYRTIFTPACNSAFI